MDNTVFPGRVNHSGGSTGRFGKCSNSRFPKSSSDKTGNTGLPSGSIHMDTNWDGGERPLMMVIFNDAGGT